MKRRTLLQVLAALVALPSWTRARLFAQTSVPAALTEANVRTLIAIAEVVLPSSMSAGARERAVADFASWVRNYKEGADRGHGYGSGGGLSAPTGPSPAARYPAQFAALDGAAKAVGVASFAGLPIDRRRPLIESALNTPQPVTRMPARPTGQNLIADFMGFFYNGAAGYDIAYNAAIGRDTCRSLDGSDKAPEPLR